MKKLLSAFALTLALFTFAACGDPTGENNNDDNENKDTYLVTEDTEFAPGWYKVTGVDPEGNTQTIYYYFTDLDSPVVRAGDDETEYLGDKLESMQKVIGFNEVQQGVITNPNFKMIKINESELPKWFIPFEAGWYKVTYERSSNNIVIEYFHFNSNKELDRVGSDTEEYKDNKFDLYKTYSSWDNFSIGLSQSNVDYSKIEEKVLPDWAKTTE